MNVPGDKYHPKSIAVYPGSFDPITNGHLNVIERALRIFEHVIVLVAANPKKSGGLFSGGERWRLVKKTTKHLSMGGISPFSREGIGWVKSAQWKDGHYTDGFAQLFDEGEEYQTPYAAIFPHTDVVTVARLGHRATVDFCTAMGARAMIRGLRSVTDFDQEFELAIANMELAEHIETVFMVPRPENHFVSSSKVREIFSLRGAEAVSRYVPEEVRRALWKKQK